MKYNALVLDIDGTLVRSGRNALPSLNVINAVNEASKILHVGIATSRSLSQILGVSKKLNLSGPSIVSGGAQIMDLTNKKILWEKAINTEDTDKILEIFESFNLAYYFHQGHEEYFSKGHIKLSKPLHISTPFIEKLLADEINKRVSQIKNVISFRVTSWENGKYIVMISHREATKENAVSKVAEILNINKKEIIGVGDGYNDIPLLRACGLKVAMGNAVPELKEIADCVVSSVEEDGVVEVINKFVK